jgi:hypothetical protein
VIGMGHQFDRCRDTLAFLGIMLVASWFCPEVSVVQVWCSLDFDCSSSWPLRFPRLDCLTGA